MANQDRPILESSSCRQEDFCDIWRPGRVHLIGVAGAGMRSLAQVLLDLGWDLSGSDLSIDSVQPLAGMGVRIYTGHSAAHLPPETDLVVYSDAIPNPNPELHRAGELKIPTVSYFEALGQLMRGKRGLAVAGTHGKSTTAAMTGKLLVDANLDPTVVYGAGTLEGRCGGRLGRGELMLVEACEYRANFLHLDPQQAVVLGIEPDHFDCYETGDQLEQAFSLFVRNVPQNGLVLAGYGCRRTARVTAGLTCRVETFGVDARADWWAKDLVCRRGVYGFAIFRHRRRLCDVRLGVAGRHNVLNALAAAALAWENGVEVKQISRGLAGFRGLRRRLEVVGTWRGVALVDDYAHHPTEVAASLEAVRRMYPGRRLWCVFQPHQVSRTEHLLDELAVSLQNADKVLVGEIFRAREPGPRPGEVTAADLAVRVRAGGAEVPEGHSTDEILRLLEARLRPGDVLITMGAGDIGKICDGFINRLRKDRAAG